MRDRLERFALLAGALGAVLWVVSLFVLEGAGNPAGPSGGGEIAEFYRDNRTPILIAGTLHVLGGFLCSSRCADSCFRAGSAGSVSSSRCCC